MKVELTKYEVEQKLLSVMHTVSYKETPIIIEAMHNILKLCEIDVKRSRTSVELFDVFAEQYIKIAQAEIIQHCIINAELSPEEQCEKLAKVYAECFILTMKAIQNTSCVLETDFEIFEYDEAAEIIKLMND